MESSLNNPYNAPASDLSRAGQSGVTYEPQVLAINGRIGRLRYLGYNFGLATAFVMIAGIGVAALGAISPRFAVWGLIAYLPALAISFIMAIRRLNDMGQPGWWSLVSIIPLLNFIFLLWLICGAGDEGSNQYGLPPAKNSTGVVVAACILPVLMVVGMLAGIAVPAYQAYVIKAKAASRALPAPSQLQAR